jgi:glycosyltransferase involved in cell wall biosynthesis
MIASKMVLSIIAPNIKTGGGKELLEYLLKYIDQEYPHLVVNVYLDSSLVNIKEADNRKIFLLSSSLEKVLLFGKKINNALYFGNLPPFRRASNTIVYIHSTHVVMAYTKLWSYSAHFFFKYSIQNMYIKIFIKNVDIVACQTTIMRDAIKSNFRHKNIRLLPFFQLCNNYKKIENVKKYDFCYVSLGHEYKNHKLLFDALELVAKKRLNLRLAVTIEKDRYALIDQISRINAIGSVQITNMGVISKKSVCKLYNDSRCLVFPSLEESFGLPLIEAAEMGLDIIAADLQYVFEVVNPSLVFDPGNPQSCANVIEKYLTQGQHITSSSVVENKIDHLVESFLRV